MGLSASRSSAKQRQADGLRKEGDQNARRAAGGEQPHSLWSRALSSRFMQELRWTFTWPMLWIQSVAVNLALAVFYLLFRQPNLGGHYDTVLLYCVYFSTFILADVTTTNIFGLDVPRTTEALKEGQSFLRILLRKNAVQCVVIVLPMLVITAGWTEYLYHDSEMLRTVPGVLYPMVLFMAVGNLISVLFPVAQAPFSWHVRTWRSWRCQVPLLISYAIPWVIFAVWVYTDLPGWLNGMLMDAGSDDFVPPAENATALLVASFVIYWLVTLLSALLFRWRGFVFLGQKSLVEQAPFDEEMREALAEWWPESGREADACATS
ncbi:hypothetical protein [Schaalia sp. Marseille-Q2122]|uniref:hypothetical protein n=1 Tax=Schaalia sp. Marseille-Q2122 TaxID=2736604 RepID=UPI00158BFB9C|nr:hypothetical protein [Schaalia sp. Marseille-Q2122]